MKKLSTAWKIAIVASLIAIITLLILFLPLFGRPILSLTEERTIQADIVMLEETRDTLRFSTVQHVYRVVFPYDFMKVPLNELAVWKKLGLEGNPEMGKVLNFLDKVQSLDLSTLEPADRIWIETWRLCRETGIKYQAPQHHFVVATLIVEAGFDFDGTAFANPNTVSPEERQRWFHTDVVTNEQGPQRIAYLTLPRAKVLEVRIEDREQRAGKVRSDSFPDIPLTPSQWQKIAGFMSRNYVDTALQEGILESAQSNARVFMTEFLKGGAYHQVHVDFAP